MSNFNFGYKSQKSFTDSTPISSFIEKGEIGINKYEWANNRIKEFKENSLWF